MFLMIFYDYREEKGFKAKQRALAHKTLIGEIQGNGRFKLVCDYRTTKKETAEEQGILSRSVSKCKINKKNIEIQSNKLIFQSPSIFQINHKINSMPTFPKINIIKIMPVIMESLKRQAATRAIIASATM
jgi:hypothetical protein